MRGWGRGEYKAQSGDGMVGLLEHAVNLCAAASPASVGGRSLSSRHAGAPLRAGQRAAPFLPQAAAPPLPPFCSPPPPVPPRLITQTASADTRPLAIPWLARPVAHRPPRPAPTLSRLILSQATANFKHELSALRSSFRFNEYDPMLSASTGPLAKVGIGRMHTLTRVCVCVSVCARVRVCCVHKGGLDGHRAAQRALVDAAHVSKHALGPVCARARCVGLPRAL
jgi:hypothetical protein